MAELEKLAAQLPPGIGYEWTGLSREEKLSDAQAARQAAVQLQLAKAQKRAAVQGPGRLGRPVNDLRRLDSAAVGDQRPWR